MIFKLVYAVMFKCAFSRRESLTVLSTGQVLSAVGKQWAVFSFVLKEKSVLVLAVPLKVKDLVLDENSFSFSFASPLQCMSATNKYVKLALGPQG